MFTKQVRRIFIAVAGVTVVLLGIAMIVLPGPAIIVIPVGLAILGTEFAWARSLNKKMKDKVTGVGQMIRGGFTIGKVEKDAGGQEGEASDSAGRVIPEKKQVEASHH